MSYSTAISQQHHTSAADSSAVTSAAVEASYTPQASPQEEQPRQNTYKNNRQDNRLKIVREEGSTLLQDSIANDTAQQPRQVIVISPEHKPHTPTMRQTTDGDISWLIMALLLLMVTIGLKFRRSSRFLTLLLRNLTDTRQRNNMFDETVRESSFMFLLNTTFLVSAGVILYYSVMPQAPLYPAILISISVALAYGFIIWLMYWIWGSIFTTANYTRIWLRGHLSTQAILGLILILPAILCALYPTWASALAYTALGIFILAKIIFIRKGAVIFLHSGTSVILFFYYLCALEIVPLISAYHIVCALCSGVAAE